MVLEGTCLQGVIEPAIAHVGMATYVKWQSKGQRSPSAIFSSSECVCDLFSFKTSEERILGAEFLVSVLKELKNRDN